jgi:hypothetical protein
MGSTNFRTSAVWALAKHQHGVIARRQLLALGASAKWVQHRIERRRLHPIWRGTYAVGRAELTRHGRWMAAVLTCGEGALLSHQSAAELRAVCRIPVTDPVATFIDLATQLERDDLDAAINAADRLDLITPDGLRSGLEAKLARAGVPHLREVLDARTFTLTDSQLERLFFPLAADAGLPPPLTQQSLNGYRVDFYWPALGLVVETDGLRYHRTPAQQAADQVRDQAHTAAGLVPLRFNHAQVRYEPGYGSGRLHPSPLVDRASGAR